MSGVVQTRSPMLSRRMTRMRMELRAVLLTCAQLEADLGRRKQAAQPQLVEVLPARPEIDEEAQQRHEESIQQVEPVEGDAYRFELEAGLGIERRHLPGVRLLPGLDEVAHRV